MPSSVPLPSNKLAPRTWRPERSPLAWEHQEATEQMPEEGNPGACVTPFPISRGVNQIERDADVSMDGTSSHVL